MTQQWGKYQLVRKLATGGMAEVFLAKAEGPMGFEKTLVLKRILPHLAEEPTFVAMFLAEAKLAARLTHSHIAQIFDFGEAEGAYFLAMEYIDGPSLRTLIRRAATHERELPPALCARLISHACEGLAFAHDFADPETGEPLGLIHRDISPDNILLSRQGEVKVVDFGIAKAAGQSHRTEAGALKGKLPYMPPEQVRSGPLDRRTDVYALGVVLYELLTQRKPFTAGNDSDLMRVIIQQAPVPAHELRPDLPEALSAVLDRALAKDREQRYPDCHAFQADLEDFLLSLGRPVTTQQVAQFIQHTLAGSDYPTSSPLSGSGGGSARGSRPSSPAPVPVPIPEPAVEARPSRRGRPGGALMGAGVLLLGVLAGLGWWALRPAPLAPVAPPAPVAPSAPVGPPPREAPVVAARPVEPRPEPRPEPTSEPDSEPTPEAPEPTPEAPEPAAKPKRAGAVRAGPKGTLELRIFPYATVFVDGRLLGETPLAPTALPAGRHTVKLVNEQLGKTVVRAIEVKPEQTTQLKVNLQEE